MKNTILLFIVFVSTCLYANVSIVKALPESNFLDGEVSTNVYINVSDTTNTTRFKLDIEFSSNISNEVQVLVGQDVDTNGVLDTEEAQICFGWSKGTWQLFHMDNPNDILFSQEASRTGKKGSFSLFLSEAGSPLKLQMVTDTNVVATSIIDQALCYFDTNWNMAKIVHRGCGISDSSFAVRLEAETLLILLK